MLNVTPSVEGEVPLLALSASQLAPVTEAVHGLRNGARQTQAHGSRIEAWRSPPRNLRRRDARVATVNDHVGPAFVRAEPDDVHAPIIRRTRDQAPAAPLGWSRKPGRHIAPKLVSPQSPAPGWFRNRHRKPRRSEKPTRPDWLGPGPTTAPSAGVGTIAGPVTGATLAMSCTNKSLVLAR